MTNFNPYLRLAHEARDMVQHHKEAGRADQAAWFANMFRIHKQAAIEWAKRNPVERVKVRSNRTYPVSMPVARRA